MWCAAAPVRSWKRPRTYLDDLTETALRPIREECERAAIEALVGAMLRFAERHPDAPRAKPEPVPA